MKLAITGSRSITDKDWVYAQLNELLRQLHAKSKTAQSVVVLSGGALGIDTLVRGYCEDKKLDFVLFKPYHLVDNKVKFETKYFFARNRQIVDNADIVVCIWDGVSHGTSHVMEYAEKKSKQLVVIKR